MASSPSELLAAILPADRLRTPDSPGDIERYAKPERGLAGWTELVLLPANPAEVGLILAAATEHHIPLVISAGRTGLVEAQRPEGEVVISLERLQRFVALDLPDGRSIDLSSTDPAEIPSLLRKLQASGEIPTDPDTPMCLTVQAGVSVDAANLALREIGRCIPIEMGSTSAATLAACVANGSAGANAVCYGTASSMAQGVRGYLAKGVEVAQVAPPSTPPPADGLRINSASLPYGNSLIGSQGLFGVITEVTLRTWPLPAARSGLLLGFPDFAEATRFMQALCASHPGQVEEVEYLSAWSLELVHTCHPSHPRYPFAHGKLPETPVFLLVQIKGEDETTLQETLFEHCLEFHLDEQAISAAPLRELKHLRHSITESSNIYAGKFRSSAADQVEEYRVAFDVAVPLPQVAAFFEAVTRSLGEQFPQLELLGYGHLGVGGFHLHLIRSDGQKLNAQRAEIVDLVARLAVEHGGTYSAEHGVGTKWAKQFLRYTPSTELSRIAAWIHEADPAGILQPRCFAKRELLRQFPC